LINTLGIIIKFFRTGLVIIISIIAIYLFAWYTHYVVTNGQIVWGVSNKVLTGKYIFEYKKNIYYKMYLNNDYTLEIKKYIGDNIEWTDEGTWKISEIGGTIFLDEKLFNVDNTKLSLGVIQMNLFSRKVTIEALSLGNFYGKDSNTYFIKN
jgi:hypothetical protein